MDQSMLMQENDLTFIKIPYSKEKDPMLTIEVPRCKVTIAPGLGNAWVNGRYVDEKRVAGLAIRESGNLTEILATSSFSYRAPESYLPQLNISFGRQKPFGLKIRAGDIADHFDLGGLPISTLMIQYSTGEHEIDFSYPGEILMERMEIMADGGPISIDHLANASPAEIRLRGETKKCRIDFGDEIKQDINLYIGIDISNPEIIVRSSTAIAIRYGYPPDNIDLEGFTFQDKEYWNDPALKQEGPLLHIYNSSAKGFLRLQTI